MIQRKERLTVTVDPSLVQAGAAAVAAGRAESLSGWVNLALAERAAKERRLLALTDALTSYEAKFGVISEDELVEQARADRQQAVVVRGPKKRRVRTARRARP